jgi:hypothetical protein
MPWIEYDFDFYEHPRTQQLAQLLHCKREKVVTGLMEFWCWCLRYAPDGDLRKCSPSQIAEAFRYYPSRAEKLMNAMIESGWLDVVPYFRVHNWWKHAGTYLQSKHRRHPELWRKIRSLYEGPSVSEENLEILPETVEERGVPAGTVPVQHMYSTGTVQDYITTPEITVPDKTKQDHHHLPHNPLLREEGGGGGGGFDDLKTDIYRMTGVKRLSVGDEARLKDLYERHGREAFEACSWLHGAVTNVPAYLKAVLEKRSRIEIIAEKARRLLRAEGKEAR